MTENQLRQKIIDIALSFLGVTEGSAGHEKILALYNSYTPHPRGYVLTAADPWCAGFVSAVAIACGLTDIIPVECSCARMIALFKALGRWQEADDYVPKPGDIGFFDWQDQGAGDNTGAPDHVGIVVSVEDGTIRFIEGNKDSMVAERIIAVGGKYLRGFATPDYAVKAGKSTYTLTFSILRRGSEGLQVEVLQRLLIAQGYKMTARGKDYGADGIFGKATGNAVRMAQRENGWQVDGEVGPETMGGLLGLSPIRKGGEKWTKN